jgi:hypothetical protein
MAAQQGQPAPMVLRQPSGAPPIDSSANIADVIRVAQQAESSDEAQSFPPGSLDIIRQRMRDNINTVPDNPITRLLTTNPNAKFDSGVGDSSVRHHYTSPASKMAPPTLDDLPGYGLINSIFGDGGIADLYKNAQQQEDEKNNSPEAIWNRLRSQAGEFGYNGPSAEQMAKEEFDPQFELLKSLADEQTKRYQSNKADISGMYNQLVGDQTAARGQDKAMYDAAVGSTGASYDAASKGLTDNTAAYSKAMAAEMARLGIKEGAGDIVGGVKNNLQDNLTRLSSQGQGTKDLLTGLGASEYTYDTNQIGVAKQAGINTQNDFLKDYMGSMAQNDQQRLQLTGAQQQAENQYDMQIQKMLQEGQSSFEDSLLGQYKAIMEGNQRQSDDFYRQAGLDLDQQKFAYQQSQDALKTQNSGPKNAYDALSERALSSYGDPTKARAAVNEILAQYQRNPRAQSVGEFLNGIENQDALKADPQMTSLIYDFISRILADQKK